MQSKPNLRRILFTGGRDFKDAAFVDHVFCELEPDVVIVGDARGLDRLVANTAQKYSTPLFQFFAEWGRLGNSAGVLRNQRMLEIGQPTMGAVFPGGPGTQDMTTRLKLNKIPFQIWTPGG